MELVTYDVIISFFLFIQAGVFEEVFDFAAIQVYIYDTMHEPS